MFLNEKLGDLVYCLYSAIQEIPEFLRMFEENQ